MSLKNTLGKVGVGLAGFAFRIAFYACMAVLIFWAGKQAYTFGYQVFDQEAISPGDGSLVAVTIPTGANDYEIAQILETRGLVANANVFFAQELLSGYRGMLQSGSYTLSTAYTPTRIMSILAGEESDGAANAG